MLARAGVFFDGFQLAHLDVGEVTLRVRYGGSGPPVLLLHGHPRTHTTWYRVAPLLARQFTVVCPDLRGYGKSTKPRTTADHAPYSKRAMARDCLALMRQLGHERFAVAGHDRGSYVASRLTLDHPSAVRRLAVLDGVPIGEALARCTAQFAQRWWHWFFLGQIAQRAERVISADPDSWYGGSPAAMGLENFADFRRAIHDPETVHAMCEDYRAGLGLDRTADDADRQAGRLIAAPVLFLWAAGDDMAELYGEPLQIWRTWASDVRGHALPSGHHMAEEVPELLATALGQFFDQ